MDAVRSNKHQHESSINKVTDVTHPQHNLIFNRLEEGEDDENDSDEIKQLKIYYININGLNQSKINNTDMIKDMDDADILCFAETHLKNEDQFPMIRNYTGYHSIGKKSTNLGRNIRGISLYVKDDIQNIKIENIVNENGRILIAKIIVHTSCIYAIICYRSNRESKYKDKEFYQIIKDYIIQHNMENIIMIGDLNGRIGVENDNKNLGLPMRKSEDSTVNSYGQEIITFCNETKLVIANGRFENENSVGKCTYHCILNNEVKKSMIDYFIVSESVLKILNEFDIGNPVLYTDHSHLKIKLNITSNKRIILENDRPQNKKIMPYKWTEENASTFDSDKFSLKCSALSRKLTTCNMNANDIYTELLQIKNNSTHFHARKKSKYSENTSKLRRIYRKEVASFKENRSDNNLKKLMSSRKLLQKQIRKEKRKIKSKNFDRLIIAKDNNDHKEYWRILNGKKRTTITSKLKMMDFKTEMMNSELCENVQDCIISEKSRDLNMSTDFADILDAEIALRELQSNLKNTKNSKSSGPDQFVSDIFKINENALPILQILYNKLLLDNQEPIPFSESWIVPVYKKSDKNMANSYHPFNLSSNIGKLLTKILNNRLSKW